MTFTRRISIIVLALTFFSSSAQAVGCVPKAKTETRPATICLAQPCDTTGSLLLDGDNVNLIACLCPEGADGCTNGTVWKQVSIGNSNVLHPRGCSGDNEVVQWIIPQSGPAYWTCTDSSNWPVTQDQLGTWFSGAVTAIALICCGWH